MKKSLFDIMEDVVFLKKNTFFAEVPTEELKAIAVISQVIRLEESDLVVREGDIGDSFFIIKEGSVKITKGEGEKEINLAVLPEHFSFGEMAIFENIPRTANCFANESCVLLKISRDDLLEVINDQPGISIELLKVFSRRIREANKKIQDLSKKR